MAKTINLTGTRLRILSFCSITASLLLLLSFLIYPAILPSSTHAEPGVVPIPTLTIGSSNSIALSVTPGQFSSSSQPITVETTNYTGYTMTIAPSDGNTNLESNSVSNAVIPSISEELTSSDFSNLSTSAYGLSIDDGANYSPIENGSTLKITNNPTDAETGSFNLTLGAKAAIDTPAGTYTKEFVLTAIANPAAYIVNYNANAGEDEVGDMPDPNPQTEGSVSGANLTLSDAIPSRAGYNFLGWSEDPNAVTASYYPKSIYELNQTELTVITLYAVWEDTSNLLTYNMYANGGTFTNGTPLNSAYFQESCGPGVLPRYSHTPNLNDNGSRNNDYIGSSGNAGYYANYANMNEVVTIPGATSLKITLIYGSESTSYDWVSVWSGEHPDYTASGNYNASEKVLLGSVTTNKYGGSKRTVSGIIPNTNSVTFAFKSDGSGAGSGEAAGYGYYAIVTGLDENDDDLLETVCAYERSSGNYEVPTREGYIFLGWSTDQNATTPDFTTEEEVLGEPTGDLGSIKTFFAVWVRAITITIEFDDGVSNVTIDNNSLSSGETTVLAEGFVYPIVMSIKTGHAFDKWVATSGSFEYQTRATNYTVGSDDATITGTTIEAEPMQAWNGCSALSTGDTEKLYDTRDSQAYEVVKLADGNCWMANNLDLGRSSITVDLTSDNTNLNPGTTVAAATFNGWKKDSSIDGSGTTADYLSLNQTVSSNHLDYDTTSDIPYGTLYDYCATSAGTYCYGETDSAATAQSNNDICPAGWRLPIGGPNGEFAYLYSLPEYNTGAKLHASIADGGAAFAFAGRIWPSTPTEQGSSGHYWTSTRSTGGNMYELYASSSSVYPSNYKLRYNALSVRCLAYIGTGSVHYDANGGSGEMSDQNNVSIDRTNVLANEFTAPNDHKQFRNWCTEPDGSGKCVEAGMSISRTGVTNGESVTLYAQWDDIYYLTYINTATHASQDKIVIAGQSTTIDTGSSYYYSGNKLIGWDTVDNDASGETSGTPVYALGESFTPTGDIVFYTVWRPTYSIEYDINGGDEGTMYSTSNIVINDSVDLKASNFSRANYGFAGWNTKSDGTGTQYGPNETITAPSRPDSGALTLYATWIASSGNLQGWNSCDSLAVGNVIALKDTRDGEVYTVAKLADNKCWIVENLRFDPAGKTLDSNNTNNPETTFSETALNLQQSSFSGCGSYIYASCIDIYGVGLGNITKTNSADETYSYTNRRWYSYGAMYNWHSATAGHGTYETQTTVDGDICPAGWSLPSGKDDSRGSFSYLNSMVNNDAEAAQSSRGLRAYPNNFILSGYYDTSSSARDRGSNGYYWSKDGGTGSNDRSNAYILSFSKTYVSTSHLNFKDEGYAVRCLNSSLYDLTIDVDNNVTDLVIRKGSTSATDVTGTKTGSTYTFTGLTEGSNYYLVPTFTNGYEFNRWTKLDSTDGASLNSSYKENTFYTIGFGNGSLSLASKQTVTFDMAYAAAGKTKQNNYYTMQDMNSTICSAVSNGQTSALIDTRDNQTYTVAKYKMSNDGAQSSCWMSSNLNLGAEPLAVQELNSSNTHLPSDNSKNISSTIFDSWNMSSTGDSNSYTDPQFMPITDTSADNYGNKYGTLYNYAAASAGTYTYQENASEGDAQYDLCPAGWRLPTGGSSGEFKAFTDANAPTEVTLQSDYGFPLTGYYANGTINFTGIYGNYWTSTRRDDNQMSTLYIFYTSSFSPTDTGLRSRGWAVRCIAE